MYAYQDNKIFLGQNRKVTALSYDQNTELFALGFETGSIKILKLEEKQNGESNQLEIVINENLNDTHQSSIKTLSWNVQYEKLLSVDESGLMIVWTEGEETYEEEMINESENDQIMFSQWSKKGNYILIIFQSGNIILGNVEGERLWSKELKINIRFFDWLESDETIVISDKKGELLALETVSNEIFAEFDVSQEQIKNQGEKKLKREQTEVFGDVKNKEISTEVAFFQGNTLQNEDSRLVLAYESGEVYIIMNLRECDMKKFAFGFDRILGGIWNKEGDLFMLQTITNEVNGMYLLDKNGGIQICFENPEAVSQMEFIQNASKFISINQNMMYLTRIKQSYDCCYLQSKGVFVIALKKNKVDTVLFLYHLEKKTIKKKIIKNFVKLSSNNQDTFIILTHHQKFEAFLVNENGAFIQSLVLLFRPQHMTYKDNKVLFYYQGNIILWDLDSHTKSSNLGRRIFYFNLREKQSVKDITQFPEYQVDNEEYSQFIECQQVTRNLIYLCNEKGYIRRFDVKTFQEQSPLMLNVRPMKIQVNKQETHLAIIDFEKNLIIKYIGDESEQKKEIFEMTQVWDFQWSGNGVDFFYIRKDRIFQKSLNSENPHEAPQDQDGIKTDLFFVGVTFPNLILFDLELFVKVIKDFNLENYKSFEFYQKKTLSIIQQIEEKINGDENTTLEELQKNINKDDQKVIKYIGDLFLIKGNYEEAEKAYRFLNDYSALKFIQRIKDGLQNEMYKQAEKFVFLNQLDKASEILVNNNKENLLIKILLDYDLYEESLQFESLIDQDNLQMIYDKLGQQYLDKGVYSKAQKYFEKTNNVNKLIEVYCLNQNFEKLVSLCEHEKNRSLLKKLAEYLMQNNMIEMAVRILEKFSEGKKAVDLAILHNYWGTAVEISEKNNFQQIDNVLNKFASILMEKNQKMEVVQLYRKAKKNLEAAKMLSQIADDLIKKNNSALLVKKIYVLSALEINIEKQKRFNPNLTANLTNITLTDQSRNNTMNTLNTLITSDTSMIADKILINPWKGAEAWHLYLIAIRNLKNREYLEGYIVSNKLSNYELELGQKRIFILGALFSKKLGQMKQYSKYLSKLSHYAKQSKDHQLQRQVQTICLETFKEQEPYNIPLEGVEIFKCVGKGCDNEISNLDSFCSQCGSSFGICMVSGRGVYVRDYVKCKICKHKLLREEITKRNLIHCSLCHQKLDLEKNKQL